MNQQTQNPLVFTLSDEPADSAPASGTEDWEQGLARLRQKRRQPGGQDRPPAAPAAEALRTVFTLEESPPAVKPAAPKAAQILEAGRKRKLSLDEQKQTYQAYLRHWQEQHNRHNPDADLDNPQILFQEDWLNAQNALHIGRSDPAAGQATVWLSRRQTRVSGGQTILDKLNALEAAQQQAGDTAAEAPSAAPAEPAPAEHSDSEAALLAAAEKIVLLNVYAPPEQTGRKVLCLSEAVLLERLAEKLRPHLADAVAGMVKTTVQKQTAAMIQQMQQSLLDEVPQLVDDILAHNLARALSAVKHEQLRTAPAAGGTPGNLAP